MQLTFASYNVHKALGLDGKRDPERIIAVLRQIDADIIALQEVDRRFGQRPSAIPRRLLDDTPWQPLQLSRRRQSLGWHGNGLLIRRGLDCVDCGGLDLPTLEPRGAVMAELAHQRHRFCVIGTHLDLSGLRRREQIRTILDYVSGRCSHLPTIIMGDFNQWGRASGAMREFTPGWQVLTSPPSFPARRPVARLDRIVASRHWLAEQAEAHHSALSALASDHLPIYARLELPEN